MDLRHLRAFVTIVDAGGFARAGARLNLSQPALSRQIRAFETELGVQLFDRVGRRIQLTAEGQDLLRRARELLTGADSLGERAPSTLIALARIGYGIAIVPSNLRIARDGLRVVPLVLRGAPIGRWLSVAWDPRRFLAPYAEAFVEELAAHAKRAWAKPAFARRAPPLPRPKDLPPG